MEDLRGATAIVTGAFTAEGISGGVIGVLFQGFKRAAFSNEAGVGSAAIAHSAVQTNEPASEGLVSLLEPFIDTVVICTLSSLVIVTTAYPNGLIDSGLERMLAASDPDDVRRHLQLMQGVKQLTLPSEMGERFKVMALALDTPVSLSGFTTRDLRDRL